MLQNRCADNMKIKLILYSKHLQHTAAPTQVYRASPKTQSNPTVTVSSLHTFYHQIYCFFLSSPAFSVTVDCPDLAYPPTSFNKTQIKPTATTAAVPTPTH